MTLEIPTPVAENSPTPDHLAPAPAPAVPLELEQLRQLGYWLSLAESDEDSAQTRGAAAALRFALAQMLGVSPTAALTELSFIHGRLNLSAQLVRALALKRGYRVVPVERTDEACTAQLVDAATGEVLGETRYTLEDARRAGLIRAGGGYVKSPGRMLWARASKRVVDDFAPEVSLGITTPEEDEEIMVSTVSAPVADEPSAEPVADDDPTVAMGADAATEAGADAASGAGTVAATDAPASASPSGSTPTEAGADVELPPDDADIPVFPEYRERDDAPDDDPPADDLTADEATR
jgi:hypothetical protein